LAAFVVAAALIGVARPSFADPSDPGGAREQLKLGFALKQQNKCVEALPHFEESLRLDAATVKARLNMADCLETVGQLVRAAKEWATLRDQATDEPLRDEAKKRLAAVEKRLPRLTVSIAGDRTGTLVRRDGIELRGLSLDVPLPVDPGPHTVVLEREGNEPSTQKIGLVEGETKTVTLTPGAARAAAPASSASAPAASSVAASVGSVPAEPVAPPGASSAESLGPQRIAGLAVAGAGVVALGVATFAFVSASGKQDDALAQCGARGCPATAYPLHEDAKSLATIGNVGLVAGGLLVAGGATLYFTAKKSPASAASRSRVQTAATPSVGPSSLGLSFEGSF
jgi:hypothetical protein